MRCCRRGAADHPHATPGAGWRGGPAERRDFMTHDEFEQLSPEEQDAIEQAAFTEAVRELYANGTFREVPCRACGAVTFFSSPTEEFCLDCQHEHWWMRQITLAKDRYCPHCELIRI